MSPGWGRGMHRFAVQEGTPIFFSVAPKRKRPFTVKRKGAFVSKSRLWRVWTSTEVVRDGAPVSRKPSTGCAVPLRNRDGAFPHLSVWNGFRGGRRMAPASLSALPASLSADRFEVGRAAAAGRRKSNRFCSPTSQFPVAGRRLKHSARPGPRPTLKLASTAQCLLLGPHVLSK